MKKSCYSCRAWSWNKEKREAECMLGHSIRCIRTCEINHSSFYKPEEQCEKPKTYGELEKLGVPQSSPRLSFGDVIYRPCINQGERTDFVNTCIVRRMFKRGNNEYVESIDGIGQIWTDNIRDLGVHLFKTRSAAQRSLEELVNAREHATEAAETQLRRVTK